MLRAAVMSSFFYSGYYSQATSKALWLQTNVVTQPRNTALIDLIRARHSAMVGVRWLKAMRKDLPRVMGTYHYLAMF